jgi:SAM-dependent methyltransferase
MNALEPTGRFSSRVEDYVRWRPGYPAELLPLLRAHCQLTRDSVAADIGSGTGLFTRLLLENGNLVYAVEPNAEMRRAAERALAGFARFRSVAAPAEATGLPAHSIDLISAAQAAHWFDIPRVKSEFRRIVKPGGRLALIWNSRRADSTAFLRDYEALLERRGTDYREISASQGDEARVREIFAPAGFERHTLDHAQQFDCDGLIGRTLSSSYTPQPGHPGYEPMIGELREMFARHQQGGRVRFDYDTRVYLGRLTPSPRRD